MQSFDLERMTAGGVTIGHHDGKVVTDGPWLILYDRTDLIAAIVPAHAVVALLPCEGRCRDGSGE